MLALTPGPIPNPASGDYLLGAEVGPAVIRAGVFSGEGKLLGKTKLSTKLERGPEAVLARVRRCLAYAADECDVPLSRIRAVGVGVPALVVDGVVRVSSSLDWREVPLQQVLEQQLSVPVAVANLHNLAAHAIATQEFPQSPRPLVVVFFGAEIGGAVLRDHGWVALEAVEHSRLGLHSPAENILAALSPSEFSHFRGRDFRRALRAGSAEVRAFLLQSADVAARMATVLCVEFGARTLVLAGGAVEEMREELLQRVRSVLPPSVVSSVLVSRLGDLPSLAGAAMVANSRGRVAGVRA